MMHRHWLLAVVTACGCNTCLAPSTIPFVGGDAAILSDASPTDEADVSRDMEADADPDADCVDPSDLCEQRACGMLVVNDACGVERSEDCGDCGEGGTCSPSGTCSCATGFDVVDGRCSDIDECALDQDDCEPTDFCINTPGTWMCSDCPAGQERNDQQICVDINECDRGTDNCDPRVTCTNADPPFVCGDCPMGYDDTNGDGTQCDDVDECATSVDDCDTNATCTNKPGSFNCSCNAGWFGTGRSCSLNPAQTLVLSVRQASLFVGNRTASVALPAAVVAPQVVVFATARNSGVDGKSEAIHVDVWVDNGRVQASRGSDDGDASVELSLVEFGAATVQRGTFSLGTSATEAIAPVDPTKAFVVFSNEVQDPDAGRRSNSRVRAALGASEVVFSRSGTGGTARGHFSVVSAASGMSVAHLAVTIPGSSACAMTATSAPTDRSFVLYSSEGPEILGATDDPSGAYAQCGLTGTAVECCRGNAAAPLGADDIVLNVQVVTFDATTNGAVPHRGETVSGQPTAVTLPSAVDRSYSMVTSGMLGALGASTAGSNINSNDEGAAFVTLQLVADDTIEVFRGQGTNTPVQTRWEVVTWPH